MFWKNCVVDLNSRKKKLNSTAGRFSVLFCKCYKAHSQPGICTHLFPIRFSKRAAPLSQFSFIKLSKYSTQTVEFSPVARRAAVLNFSFTKFYFRHLSFLVLLQTRHAELPEPSAWYSTFKIKIRQCIKLNYQLTTAASKPCFFVVFKSVTHFKKL